MRSRARGGGGGDTLAEIGSRDSGIAQWLERRTRERKVAGSNPDRSGGGIFFSRVNFLCWLLFRYPFHPRVTAVARKRPRSFCQKRRWQVTAKHDYNLRMWLCTHEHTDYTKLNLHSLNRQQTETCDGRRQQHGTENMAGLEHKTPKTELFLQRSTYRLRRRRKSQITDNVNKYLPSTFDWLERIRHGTT